MWRRLGKSEKSDESSNEIVNESREREKESVSLGERSGI